MDQAPVQIGQFILGKNLGIGAFGKVRISLARPVAYPVVVVVDIKITPDPGDALFCVDAARISDMTPMFCMPNFSHMTSWIMTLLFAAPFHCTH